jgi:hypothetical protein
LPSSKTSVAELITSSACSYRWRSSKIAPQEYGERLQHSGSINVNVGLADRLEAARKRLAAATAGAVIEGVALPSPQSTTLPAVATDEPELVE